jgi:hypothetical protein
MIVASIVADAEEHRPNLLRHRELSVGHQIADEWLKALAGEPLGPLDGPRDGEDLGSRSAP